MTVLGISCVNALNVLGGFFVTRRRFEVGVTSHDTKTELDRMWRFRDSVLVPEMKSDLEEHVLSYI